MRFFRAIATFLLIILLTILTQTGGVILLGCLPLFAFVNRKISTPTGRFFTKTATFCLVYLACTFIIIPPLAQVLGRVPLPVTSNPVIKPLNLLTCLLNRYYVTPELKNAIERTAAKFTRQHPGSVVHYLDANFPFWNGFPLIPHLSHNDGEKIDLAFLYTDRTTSQPVNEVPSWLGYGVCEAPQAGEENMPAICAERGYWQYSLLAVITPTIGKRRLLLDEPRTRTLIRLLAQDHTTRKIFIEPHLKRRLRLSSVAKIRFHGCQAVRHDDHIHVEL